MAADDVRDGATAPATEHIHLPGPSFLPILVALGISVALAGVILSWILFGIGIVILVPPLALWIREARQELRELPLER